MKHDPLVSVVILSYARPQHLPEVLDAVHRQTYPDVEVLVIDNRSNRSEEVARVVERYPVVRLVRNSENLGFAAGMNAGLREARGEYVFLTEDDIVLDPCCVAEFVAHYRAAPRTGMASGLQYNRRSRTIRSAGGRFRLEPRYDLEIYGWGQHDEGQYSRPFPVSFIPGGMMFARRALLQELGGFRSDFFMYLEDVELCLRVIERGNDIVVVPAAKAFHFEPEDGPVPLHIHYHRVKNFFALYLLHASPRTVGSVLPRAALHQVVHLLRQPRESLAALGGIGRTLAKAPALLLERRARAAALSAHCEFGSQGGRGE